MTVLNSRQTFTWTNVDQIPWCFLVSQGLNELNENWQFRNRFDTLRSRQNGRHFADGIFKSIFWNENCLIMIQISLKFVPKGPIDNMQALVQIMAWRRIGDKPISEPMVAWFCDAYLCHTASMSLHWSRVFFDTNPQTYCKVTRAHFPFIF